MVDPWRTVSTSAGMHRLSDHTHVVMFHLIRQRLASAQTRRSRSTGFESVERLVPDVSASAKTRREQRREALLIDTEPLQEIHQSPLNRFMRLPTPVRLDGLEYTVACARLPEPALTLVTF